MSKQFRLGQAQIDLTRNQIILAGVVQTMQPKAMAVLAELVRAQGRVVSMDELLQGVWPDTIVTPNTLQRCIAQLRKALGDDSREQNIIRTHAKQGYSLEMAAEFAAPMPPASLAVKRGGLSIPYLVVAGLVLLTLMVAGFYLKPEGQHSYGHMHYLTTTTGKESFASYSPDGRFVVFHRFEGQCENHLWSKDLHSQQETRLTKEAGYFQQHSFAPGGDRLTFVGKSLCGKADVPECWELKILDVAAALTTAQDAQTRMSCDDGRLYGPQWMNNGNIALLKKPHQGQWQLISYHVRDNLEQLLFAPDGQRLYNLAYSAGLDKLALLGKTQDGKDQLTLLSSDGEVTSSAELQWPMALSQFDLLELSFHPSQPKLLVYNTHHQFEVDFSGRVTPISLATAKAIYSLVYAPHQDKLLAAYGMQDWHFYLHSFDSDGQTPRSLPEKWESTFADKEARFQPQGELIAYVSNRSGQEQVWLMDGQRTWQLSQFTHGPIAGLSWSPSGQQLLVNHIDRLLLLDMHGQQQELIAPFAAIQLFQWTEQGEILFSSQREWQQQMIAWHPEDNQWRQWQVAPSSWAALDSQGQLLSLDNGGKLWLHQNEESPILLLSDIKKRFAWRRGQLLAVDNQNRLIHYDTAQLQLLSQQSLATPSLYIDDYDGRSVLVAEITDMQQDIVELSR
ncbi:winged helix-turn-helix domain-containing protein [Bowmanella sp. Y26]|uniref:winged helix-turn-helix domain-containing protein n=1 Tax=Bowmanella yangjiangensis TaxID=2811230 RepID=UPI001BDCC341|nr:winged helix-turn-helix domain-containing protein [Bowmanella yangjiangensis]MBT1062342.1 winged helix-turn-helix domain-containing protein [Bowmanella yangjiangensis]